MSLHEKYRPNSFLETKGKSFERLTKQLNNSSGSQSFLFIGGKGSGKTTTARIAASMLGASDIDIHEYDFGADGKIDLVRSIIDLTKMSPIGNSHVFIIDEFHGCSTAGQRALLKVIEEPPTNVYFFLCTNEPHKVIDTIRDRCSTENFPGFDEEALIEIMMDVCQKEKVNVKNSTLSKIASASDSSARKALVLLEQVIASPQEDVDKIIATGYAVEDSSPETIELCRAVYGGGDWATIAALLSNFKEKGQDAEGLRRMLLGYGTSMTLKSSKNVHKTVCFLQNLYDSGFSGLVMQCANAFLINDRR